ncbi:hypothetical protein R6U77_16530 [Lysinibacillus louembei]|uniref:Uncharacterized protein n=1 Tax=Lysinibacillus louembei TaxID=1470088 RepID=A0ABZ0RWT1_9BACI|nr:hypothetical protein [Lysinibacillus louembei]WPK11479.1 hypothetical protein R6U77_16530 [Lysinibacillus louembei]
MQKKLISLLLAVCLVLPLGLSFASTTAAAEGTTLTAIHYVFTTASAKKPASEDIPAEP